MELNKTVLIAIYALVGLYILYRLFFKKNPYQKEYERLYEKILNSDKYKVKGQYDKEDWINSLSTLFEKYILQNIQKAKGLNISNIQKGILVYAYTISVYWCIKKEVYGVQELQSPKKCFRAFLGTWALLK